MDRNGASREACQSHGKAAPVDTIAEDQGGISHKVKRPRGCLRNASEALVNIFIYIMNQEEGEAERLPPPYGSGPRVSNKDSVLPLFCPA